MMVLIWPCQMPLIADARWVRASDTVSLLFFNGVPPPALRNMVVHLDCYVFLQHTFHLSILFYMHWLHRVFDLLLSFFRFLLFLFLCHPRVFIIIRFFLCWIVRLFLDCSTRLLSSRRPSHQRVILSPFKTLHWISLELLRLTTVLPWCQTPRLDQHLDAL